VTIKVEIKNENKSKAFADISVKSATAKTSHCIAELVWKTHWGSDVTSFVLTKLAYFIKKRNFL